VAADWLLKGHSYLIDAGLGKDSRYYPGMCGASGEIGGEYVTPILNFLRERAKGKAKTTLSVLVRDHYHPLQGAEVAVNGPEGVLKAVTDANGSATFEDIKPANYRVTAARTHYRVDAETAGYNMNPHIVAGACPSSSISLEAETFVSGFVRDSKGAPAASLNLELVTVPDHPSDKISLNKPFFEARTDEDGRFRFEGVSPGRYLLGSNVIGLTISSVPPTFYPGRPERMAAVPIDVALDRDVEGLAFSLPDFGGRRDIQVCVQDENGKPVAGASVATPLGRDAEGKARLGEKLLTGETGCVHAGGYALVAYPIVANFRPPDADWRQIRSSERIVIPPSEEPTMKVLTLGKPLFTPKTK